MAKEEERRKKIIQLMKDFTLTEKEKNNRIPAFVSDFILQEYGLSDKSNPENIPDHEINEVVCKIEDLIRVKCPPNEISDVTSERRNENSKNYFMKAFESFVKAKSEYLKISRELISLLNEIDQFRERYCTHLKQKACVKHSEVEVLEKKLQLLKGESILKMYSENNAIDAHLKLMEILSEKLKKSELEYNDLVELDAKYNELKDNKMYMELLSTYKQLLKREKKLDYMIEK